MAEFREAGLRCWLIVQNLEQLQRIYGRDGAQEIVNLCGIKQFFRVDDLELARKLEATIGTYTARSVSTSDGWSDREHSKGPVQNRNLSQSESISEIGVPLLRAQDIMNLPPSGQIITATGMTRPILAVLKPYFHDPELREAIAPNPYRPELPPLEVAPEKPRVPYMIAIPLAAAFCGIIGALLASLAFLLFTSWPDEKISQMGVLAGIIIGFIVYLYGCWEALSAYSAAKKPKLLALPAPEPETEPST